MRETHPPINRRKFIGSTSAAFFGFSILPNHVIAGLGHRAPSDKLNIAGIGVGGIGYTNLKSMELENIVALCDVDENYALRNSYREWPTAPQYKDYRVMFEKQNDIDAVVIATPDHSHALPALIAMRNGIHVYLQQPLTHSVFESRILAETAEKYEVSTQMGNQGNSGEGFRLICEWIWAGKIGEVTHVDAWTNNPTWQQGLETPQKEMRIPKTLDWDLFLGPAKYRAYNDMYHPWNWRRWWDFGSGALGDMACHILDPVFKALQLQYPEAIQASSTPVYLDSAPIAEKIEYEFPARDNLPKVGMPPVKVTWYDGGMKPSVPDELEDGEQMGDEKGGCIFHGTKGKIMCGSFAKNPTLLPLNEMNHFDQPTKSIRRIENAFEGGHEKDWVRACKETPQNRVKASSDFAYASLLNETVALGAITVRMQSLHKTLKWDGKNMHFTNISDQDQLKMLVNDEFSIVSGDPRNKQEFTTLPARQMAERWIRHNYRQGWEQI